MMVRGLMTLVLAAPLLAQADCNPYLAEQTPKARFVLEQAVVVDTHTGLMWSRCAAGYEFANDTCERRDAQPDQMTWQDSLNWAAEAQLADRDDWRLPNRTELESITERRCAQPAVNAEVFPATPAAGFWSSSTLNYNGGQAWSVDFARGDHVTGSKTEPRAARLVRSVNR